MHHITLPNFNVLKSKLSENLYNSLLNECLDVSNKKEMVSGLSKEGVPKHFFVEENANELHNFIDTMIYEYREKYPEYMSSFHFVNTNLPLVHGKTWINYQKENEYVPLHEHDGIFSYSLWIKIPVESEFNFNYNAVTGKNLTHRIILNKEDEGVIILFPSLLRHVVYPFYNSNETRISVSGNVELDGKK